MKKILFIILFLISTLSSAQIIQGYKFKIDHKDLVFCLDQDTCSLVSIHYMKKENLKKLDGPRKDRWHTEAPYGPYRRSLYVHTGYDLGHLTPSKITIYDDSINYHSFSMFNQAPQLGLFNQQPWRKMEMQVLDTLQLLKVDAKIITGVVYNTKKKSYLANSRIKIPVYYYKIVMFKNEKLIYLGSNDEKAKVEKVDYKKLQSIFKSNGYDKPIISF